ncbi:hypothetical protein QG37_06999 [Candidozyma auris]|nr:hypothetical protein QG37_06999 [[Candida] auris]
MHQFYCVYLLQSLPKPASFYVGSTPDPVRRLRQHNGYIAKGGAYRTKKNGFRPWIMVACVCGFPSKVAALQFESALQHPFQSRHIHKKISKSARSAASAHQRLGNIRLLVEAPAFKRMALQVWIFNDRIHDIWEQNRYHIECSARVTRTTFDEAFNSKGEHSLHGITTSEYERVSRALEASNASCYACNTAIDATNGIFMCICDFSFHPHCLLRSFLTGSSEIIPCNGKCPHCSVQHIWADIAKMISLSQRASSGLTAIMPYKPDNQLSQQVDHNSS